MQHKFECFLAPFVGTRLSSDGPDHSPVFTVEVLVEDEVVGTGQGGRKADAERTAAQDALVRLGPASEKNQPV